MEIKASSALSPQARKRLRKLVPADILVGIPSHNSAHTINYVAYQAAKGLETHFPDSKSVIFVSDGNSTDGTLESVKAIRIPFQVSVVPATYVGLSGKGSAVKAIFEAARLLEVEALALVDSDLRSITSEWVKLLVSPAMNGTGFVTPFYVRHKYDGTITNFVCYPFTSSLYGKRVRQPIGGDFGLSKSLVEELLESTLWQMPYVRRFGIDIFETHTALARKLEIRQAFLGKKVHETKDPSKHLSSMFREVTASLFTCTERYEEAWKKVSGCQDVDIVGEQMYAGEPEAVRVDLKSLIRAYKEGFGKNERIYRTVLKRDVFKEVEALRRVKDTKTAFPAETWAKVVYSFCASFRREVHGKRQSLLDAFRVLWIAKVAAFVKETLELDTMKAEEKIEEEVRVFEESRPYLLDVFR